MRLLANVTVRITGNLSGKENEVAINHSTAAAVVLVKSLNIAQRVLLLFGR